MPAACPTALRLTPGKAKGSAAAAGSSGGRRLFDDSSSSGSDGDYSCGSDDDGADDNYRPELHHMSGKGKGAVLSKRKRHGQLPGAAAAAKVREGHCSIRTLPAARKWYVIATVCAFSVKKIQTLYLGKHACGNERHQHSPPQAPKHTKLLPQLQ